MIYSRLPDLFLSSLPFFLSFFLSSTSLPFPSLPHCLLRQVVAAVFIVRLLCIYSQSSHIHQLTVISSSSTMLLVYRPHPAS